MTEYPEDKYLQLSGIRHFAFCPRRWALIHIEEFWEENYLTASGRILHQRAHDGGLFEKRGDLICARALKIASGRLGIWGVCDVVEFKKSGAGIALSGYEGLWTAFPVEYKRGRSSLEDSDRLQLCAQAICLEEMLGCRIAEGAIFYGEPRRREVVTFSEELRCKVEEAALQMHKYFDSRHIPNARKGKHCLSCSLKDYCLPKLVGKTKNVRKYLEENL